MASARPPGDAAGWRQRSMPSDERDAAGSSLPPMASSHDGVMDLAPQHQPVLVRRVVGLVILGLAIPLVFTLPIPTLIHPDLRRALLLLAVLLGAIGWVREAWHPRLPAILT